MYRCAVLGGLRKAARTRAIKTVRHNQQPKIRVSRSITHRGDAEGSSAEGNALAWQRTVAKVSQDWELPRPAKMGAYMSSVADLPTVERDVLVPQRFAIPSSAGYVLYWVCNPIPPCNLCRPLNLELKIGIDVCRSFLALWLQQPSALLF